MTSPKGSGKRNTKNKATQDEGAPRPFFHIELKVLACIMSLILEERDALQYESKVWFTPKPSSPPNTELYGANSEVFYRRLIRPTVECFKRMPLIAQADSKLRRRGFFSLNPSCCACIERVLNDGCLKPNRMLAWGWSSHLPSCRKK